MIHAPGQQRYAATCIGADCGVLVVAPAGGGDRDGNANPEQFATRVSHLRHAFRRQRDRPHWQMTETGAQPKQGPSYIEVGCQHAEQSSHQHPAEVSNATTADFRFNMPEGAPAS